MKYVNIYVMALYQVYNFLLGERDADNIDIDYKKKKGMRWDGFD